MSEIPPSVIHIGVIGGGERCRDLLAKTTFDYWREDVNTPIMAVADADEAAPGMKLADELGLITSTDYRDLFDPKYNIHLIIVVSRKEGILEEVLETRPDRIRIIPYDLFDLFWDAIGLEEKRLREKKESMETILNGIRDFIVVISPEQIVLDVNAAYLDKMADSRENVIGRKCYDVFDKKFEDCEDEEFECPLREAVKNHSRIRQIRSIKLRNGRMRHIEVYVYPIWGEHGKVSKFVHISHDITSRLTEEEEFTRRLELMVEERTRQLQETHSKLLHKDKMASLGKLAASVVHEINNPLAGILNLVMLCERIIDEGPVSDKDIGRFGEYLELMESETRRISRIVSNLLAFSRQSRMNFKSVKLEHLIDVVLVMNSNLFKLNGIKVEKEIETDLPELMGAEDQLEQVFMNLISNAAEAMENSPEKRLSIKVEHSLQNNGIIILFSDTGSGIPDENMAELFEPFFTTKKKGKGVGLGLSVAYGIVKEHGGCINVESEPGKGTRFEIVLPLNHDYKSDDRMGGRYEQDQNPDCR